MKKNYNLLLRSQRGATLLAFMLILIVGISFVLVNKLNTNLIIVEGNQRTLFALKLAKEALIGYATTYPDNVNSAEGPGYLPCPDTDKDGDAESNCSDSGNTTIGRLPYKTLELTDIRDASGQELWYALSENFRYGSNKLVPLNSESPASAGLTYNGIDDIVAVIIAPGAPVGAQSRNPDEDSIIIEIDNYLEDDNSDLDTAFITIEGRDTDDNIVFNDIVVFITRDELMRAVEKRVVGEVKMMLTEYNSTYGAYPWLAPFADPKAEFRNLKNSHNGSNNSSNLTDTTVDFTEWDIQNGDVVINITDGSMALVTGVSATSLTLGALSLGSDNDFDNDDEYVVYKKNWNTNLLSGTATGGSSSVTLNDTTKDFRETGVSAGMIVDNLSDGSSGMIEEVLSATRLRVKALNGGTNNIFTSGNNYQIRSNVGRATGGSSTTLVDTAKDFVEMGILSGDLVVNLTDGSTGMINTVAANTLTLNALNFGAENDVDVNDYYYIPRYNTDGNTREGLLSFHEEGKAFPTVFDIDFDITAAAGDVVFDSTNFPSAQTTYSNALRTYLGNYAASASVSFALDEGACTWIVPDIADCQGTYEDFVSISGRDTASSNSQTQITDSAATFVTDGVKRGDLVHDYDDENFVASGTADAGSSGTTLVDAGANFAVYAAYDYVIQNDTLEAELGEAKIQGVISAIDNATSLVATAYVGEGSEPIEFRPGDSYSIYEPRKDMVVRNDASSDTNVTISRLSSTNPDFDAGEYYRIIPAARSTSGVVDSISGCASASAVCTISDADGDFVNKGVEAGDTIDNASDTPNRSFGEITAVTATTVTTRLYGGSTWNRFQTGHDYTIYHDYVHSRRHVVHARFSGDMQSVSSSGKRLREVCLGYTSDCSALGTAVAFSGNGDVPLVTIRDYEIDGTTEVGRATFTPTSASLGALKVANIDYYLAESAGDMPAWFIKNNWHQLIYVAYSPGNIPGASSPCVAGTNCLTLAGAGSPNNNKQAIVVLAGQELTTQDRATAALDAYLEQENANQSDGDTFRHAALTSTYNDQDRIVE